MVDFKLDSQEQAALVGVVAKIKGSKSYTNYSNGVRLSSKRAEASLKGEGDTFAKIGEALRSENVPSFLSDTAKGQQKVQKALDAELKQQKLQGVLKDDELSEVIYQDLFVNPGTLNKYLKNSSQEEIMIDENEGQKEDEDENEDLNKKDRKRDKRKDNDGPALGYGEGYDDKGNLIEPDDEKSDRPDYGADFWNSPEVVALRLPNRLNKEQLARAEEAYAEYYSHSQEREDEKNEEEGAEERNDKENKEEKKDKDSNTLEINGVDDDKRTNNPVDEEWVTRYDAALKRYGEANSNIWTRDNAEDEDGNRPLGLKGAFANGTEAHYTAADKMSVKTPNGKESAAEHFKEIVSLAKENEQQIKLGTTMNPQFRKALIEACAIGGVEMQGLSNEEMATYKEFCPKEVKPYELSPDIARVSLKRYLHGCDEVNGQGYTDGEITKLKAKGAVVGQNDADSARLTLCEYAKAMSGKDSQKEELLGEVVKKYGISEIQREPDEKSGELYVSKKAYASYSDDEKAKIAAANEKLLPKKDKEIDPEVAKAMQEKQGQSIN